MQQCSHNSSPVSWFVWSGSELLLQQAVFLMQISSLDSRAVEPSDLVVVSET